MTRTLGVDPGKARIGLALSDDADGHLALPFQTIVATKDLNKTIASVVKSLEGIELGDPIVVGLPLRLDGSEGDSARKARALGEALGTALGRKVLFRDERLTTALATRGLKEMGLREKDRRAVIDQSAAALILQSWLDGRVEGRE